MQTKVLIPVGFEQHCILFEPNFFNSAKSKCTQTTEEQTKKERKEKLQRQEKTNK